jgi:hypothetical protein
MSAVHIYCKNGETVFKEKFPCPWTTSEAPAWEVTYSNFYVKQAVTWQKALDISLHYAGLQALVACGAK